jgi:hypothetical protein
VRSPVAAISCSHSGHCSHRHWTRAWIGTWARFEKVCEFLVFPVEIANRSCRSSSTSTKSSINPAYLSKAGAFNGSGLAIASYSFSQGGYGVINVFFQHWTGEIRKLQLMTDGSWTGGDSTNIIATDAKNATPISAVAYAEDNISTWHIFYIDSNDIVREKISDNTTNQWRNGPIGDLQLQAMDDPNVGLQACWYGSFYGSANYSHTPLFNTGSQNYTGKDAVIGMHLWVGTDPHTIREVNWVYNTSSWSHQETFTANGHAGVGCYSWGPGSVTYLMTVDLDNSVNLMWKELDGYVTPTSQHPINKWVNSTVSIPNVMPNTSLGYTNYFYAQLNDGSIGGYNISFNAEDSTIVTSDSFVIPEKALAGSHFSVTAIPTPSGGQSLLVLDQENGTDITENTRDLSGGQWSYVSLPIPQD